MMNIVIVYEETQCSESRVYLFSRNELKREHTRLKREVPAYMAVHAGSLPLL